MSLVASAGAWSLVAALGFLSLVPWRTVGGRAAGLASYRWYTLAAAGAISLGLAANQIG